MNKDFIIIVNYDSNSKDIIISTESSSGATYKCKNIEMLKQAVEDYILDYIEESEEK